MFILLYAPHKDIYKHIQIITILLSLCEISLFYFKNVELDLPKISYCR